jgi:hypothetical protein
MKRLARPSEKIKDIYRDKAVSTPIIVQITGITPFIW